MTLPLAILQNIAKQKGKDTTEIWQTSIIERYWARPLQGDFPDMCLADFVADYRVVKRQYEDDQDNSDREEQETSKVITLLDNKGAITQRKKQAVIRYLKVSKVKDSERHFSTLLRLYMPHRGKQLKYDDQTYEELFMGGDRIVSGQSVSIRDVVVKNMDKYEHDADVIDDAWTAVQRGDRLEDGWADIAPGAETLRDEERADVRDEFSDVEDVPELPDLDNALPSTSATGRPAYTEISTHTVSPGQAENIMRSMNTKQREVFTHLRRWVLDKVKGANICAFHVFMTGGAGTGKSHVINGFQYEADRLFTPLTNSADEITVLLVAYTGTAAFNIGGQTIHSAFAIHCETKSGKYKPLGEEQLTRLRSKYSNLQILIIDEVSMVGQNMFVYVDERLKQIKQNQSPFGGVSVLAVGDFYQIPPVGDRVLYSVDPGRLCHSPWSDFTLWTLDEIMRQKDDMDFANLLNTIRSKTKENKLSASEQDLLLGRCFTSSDVPDDVLHIYPRNKDVDYFNEKQLEKCSDKVVIHAADILHARGGISKKRNTPAPKNNTMLRPSVTLASNARVMLTTNLDVADGLCNGVMGTVKRIVGTLNEFGQPQGVWVHFDNSRVGANSRRLCPPPPSVPDNCVLIKPHTEQFTYQSVNITRYQYPLRLAWACTVHKTQGKTLQKCVVSFKGTFLAGMMYVALSRVTSLEGLFIIDFSADALYCESKVTVALQNMARLRVYSTPLLSCSTPASCLTVVMHNIHSLPGHIEDFKVNPEMMSADIIGLCETWLRPTHDGLIIAGYVLLRCDRQGNTGRGGVAIYIRETMIFTQLHLSSSVIRPGIEAVLLRLNNNVHIGE